MKKKKARQKKLAGEILILILLLAILVLIVYKGFEGSSAQSNTEPELIITPSPSIEPSSEPENAIEFEPEPVGSTSPKKYIDSTSVMVNGKIVEEYKSEYEVFFPEDKDYTELSGVTSFRGNNYRNSAAYGEVSFVPDEICKLWAMNIGELTDADGTTWTGCSWTNQPLIVTWDSESLENMSSMYDEARAEKSLTEIIYPTGDGKIYFINLETGDETREPLDLGYAFKGTATLDPRGYPILYVGAGADSEDGAARVFVINLVDGSVMFEFGHNDEFALRDFNAFDASPLVDASSDQLIYPGENGVLYIIHLNTSYNEKTGELSVDPDNIVKWNYNSVRTTDDSYWLGFESSPAILNEYAFIADNGGNLMCLNLNTLELVWVQDTLDDTNSTPVIDIEDGHPYIYIGSVYHYGWRSMTTADVPIYKIDAVTGEIVWQVDYTCYAMVSSFGGVQGTIAVGKNELSDMVFVPISRTPGTSGGVLAALNKSDGSVVWERQTQIYSMSSPVDFYDSDGNGYLIFCNTGSYMYLIDGKTGEDMDCINLGSSVEASPAIYNDYAVVGSHQKIHCVKIEK